MFPLNWGEPLGWADLDGHPMSSAIIVPTPTCHAQPPRVARATTLHRAARAREKCDKEPDIATSVIVSTVRELREESNFETRPPILYGPNSCLTAGGYTRGFGREGDRRSS